MRLRAAVLLSVVLILVSACTFSDASKIKNTAEEFQTAEASQDCPALKRLTLPSVTDPCANLQDRAFRLSMMERTARWRVQRNGSDRATASTTLAENKPWEYQLQRVDGTWYVDPA